MARGKDISSDGALVCALALFWFASAVRVSGVLVRGETFGAEATLALMMVLLLPFVLRTSLSFRAAPRARATQRQERSEGTRQRP